MRSLEGQETVRESSALFTETFCVRRRPSLLSPGPRTIFAAPISLHFFYIYFLFLTFSGVTDPSREPPKDFTHFLERRVIFDLPTEVDSSLLIFNIGP